MYESEIKRRAEDAGIRAIGFCRHRGKSAVCALFPYYVKNEDSRLSLYARGRDYHGIVPSILSDILAPFDPNAEIFVDKGPHEDIEVAVKAGLGVVGKNGLLISPLYGSFCFIGYALTSLSLTPGTPIAASCLSCNACVNACPGAALTGGFHPERCASYLTQKKGALTEEESAIVQKSGYVFGCDVCQTVCPMNRDKGICLPEFERDRITGLSAEELSSMTNRDFETAYGDRAFSWRGKAVLIRNLSLFDR